MEEEGWRGRSRRRGPFGARQLPYGNEPGDGPVFFADPWGLLDDNSFPSVSGWAPSLDVVDGEKEITVRAEIPGVDPKDVDVSVSGNGLTVSGEKKESREEKGKFVYSSECSFGSFRRSVELSEGAQADHVTAEHANGIFTVRVGKSKAAAARRIPVSAK